MNAERRHSNQLDLSDSVQAAQQLLGWKLVHDSPSGYSSGYIIETEAYHWSDEASHSFRGSTKRTEVMFGPAGHLYVYLSYGMHFCINVVTGCEGDGQAVLIRALEPVEGTGLMATRRGRSSDLTNGPGKLTQAMGIDLSMNGLDLLPGNRLRLEPGCAPAGVTQTTRIGISKAIDKPWRFYVTDNKYVSKR